MGVDTKGKIKGFIRPEEIVNFISQKYDKNVSNHVSVSRVCPISECTWDHNMNEHSEDDKNWYDLCGFICFNHNGDSRMLFYHYSNINHLENLNYYKNCGLEDMVRAETTSLSLGMWNNSVEIIKDIVTHFGGGWIDEDDCDSEEYYPIESNPDGSIKPVIKVTMQDIYDKFGGIVFITDK